MSIFVLNYLFAIYFNLWSYRYGDVCFRSTRQAAAYLVPHVCHTRLEASHFSILNTHCQARNLQIPVFTEIFVLTGWGIEPKLTSLVFTSRSLLFLQKGQCDAVVGVLA